MTQQQKPTLAIIGACGFAGLQAYHIAKKHFHCLLIDTKDHFEYSPSILRAFCDNSIISDSNNDQTKSSGDIYNKISFSLPNSQQQDATTTGSTKIPPQCETFLGPTNGHVIQVNPAEKSILLKNNTKLSYDYLFIASGSNYPSHIKYAPGDESHSSRSQSLLKVHHELKEKKNIWIKGAGGVGVELAAELCTKLPDKCIILEYRSDILPRCPPKSREYAKKWLEKRGVVCMSSAEIEALRAEQEDTQSPSHSNNVNLNQQDYHVITCFGSKPNTQFLPSEFLDDSNQVIVNKYLQLKNDPNVFASGDCIAFEGEEKKMCTARFQAKFAMRNLIRLHRKQKMKQYTARPFKYNISLGDWDGIAVSGEKFLLKGLPTVLSRRVVEKRVVATLRM